MEEKFPKNQVTPAITVPHLHAVKMLTDFLTTAAAGVDLNFDETSGVSPHTSTFPNSPLSLNGGLAPHIYLSQ
jgi:hypothetical protein